jgi:hypothetical protein
MKRLFLAAVSICVWVAANAQHPHWGLKGGINLAKTEIRNSTDLDFKAGTHIGGLAHIHLSRHLALQPELMYSNQGGELELGNTEYKSKLHYVNLPILLQYMTGSGFRIQTGPQVGVLLSAKDKVNDTETDADDNFESTDFSWSFGASYITKKGFGVDARYNHGISNISDAPNNKFRNRVFQFGVFYQFRVSEYRRK